MGEAYFEFRAIFPTVRDAKLGAQVLLKYMMDQTHAFRLWHRGQLYAEDAYQFYLEIKKRYPFAFYFIKEEATPLETLMNLPGKLTNFQGEESYIPLKRSKNVLYLRILTWHLDNWDHLVTLARLLGARAGYYIDERYMNLTYVRNSNIEMLPPLEYKIKLSPSLEENLRRIKQVVLLKNL